MTRRVVVTGLGAVTPLGVGADALHARAVAGASGVRDGQGLCVDFDPTVSFSRRDCRRLDRFTQLALVAAREAVEQSGLRSVLPALADRVPCYIGTAIGGLVTLEEQLRVLETDGATLVSPLTVPKLMANAAAAHISMEFGLRGETAALVAACSGGAQAIVAGVRAIRCGDADVAVVGGAEAAVTGFTSAIFDAAGALSPSGKSVPFSAERDGFILGEGAGVLVLESSEVAEKRGAPILAEIAGYGLASDAFHVTAPEPSGAVAAAAIVQALTAGGVRPNDLDYINAHGTGTRMNDETEIRALRLALGSALDGTPISSTKSYLGHLLGAAGAVEAIATIQALRHKVAPPNWGLVELQAEFDGLHIKPHPTPLRRNRSERIGLSNSMGFGGHNVALILKA